MNYERSVYESLDRAYTDIIDAKRRLHIISQGMKNDFIGIGNKECAESIDYLIKHYEKVLKKIGRLKKQYEQNRF